MTNGEKIIVEGDYFSIIECDILEFYYCDIDEEVSELAAFKDWLYMRKV